MARKPTIKQKRFAKKYVETGNGTQSALEVYDTEDRKSASVIATENLGKLSVQALIESQCEYAMLDQIEIREELKESKKDYAVRSGVNKDIMDRGGFKAKEGGDTNIQINVYTDDQARRIAERALRAREATSSE